MKINKAIEFYKHDYAFLKLAKSTQESYAYYLKIIDKLFGQRDILKLAERELIYEFRDYINKIVPKNPRKAKYLLDVFKILVNWCFVNQLIRRNPINNPSYGIGIK